MSDADRRQYLRVLFESTIEVRTDDWRDPVATGLDVSLNGCRFHCEHSMSDGETVTISFLPDFELQGKVRWCWPIEWYYQAAVQFIDITEEEQDQLRGYIIEVTGEDYPMEMESTIPPEPAEEAEESLLEEAGDLSLDDEDMEMLDLDEDQLEGFDAAIDEDDLEDFEPLEEDDLSDFEEEEPRPAPEPQVAAARTESVVEMTEGGITPTSSEGKQCVVFGGRKEHADLLIEYLTERTGLEVEHMTKKQNMWRLMKIESLDMILIDWEEGGESDTLEVMQQTMEQFPETPFICISGPVSLEQRLNVINAGAKDYLTRPLHLSSVAQSILMQLNSSSAESVLEDPPPVMAAAGAAALDEDLSEPVDLLDDDLNLAQELDLIDEDF